MYNETKRKEMNVYRESERWKKQPKRLRLIEKERERER